MLDTNDFQRSDHDRQVFNSLPKPLWLDAATGPKVLDPDPDYIAPSLFSHTLNVNQPVHKMFQSQNLADRIMRHYWVSRLRGHPSQSLASHNLGAQFPSSSSSSELTLSPGFLPRETMLIPNVHRNVSILSPAWFIGHRFRKGMTFSGEE